MKIRIKTVCLIASLWTPSYLNLQNINFGYTLPSNFTKKVGIEKVRVYLACENVWYWSKRQGFDPATLIRERRARPPIRL